MRSRSHHMDIVSDWADGEHKAIKTQNTRSLASTTAQPFCKWFCGASSQSVKVSGQDQDHTKWNIVVMLMAQLRRCGLLGWALFGPARASKSALAQSRLGLARADRISPKKYARSGHLKTSKNTLYALVYIPQTFIWPYITIPSYQKPGDDFQQHCLVNFPSVNIAKECGINLLQMA